MTSAKVPDSEYGDGSPELDVLTGPPAGVSPVSPDESVPAITGAPVEAPPPGVLVLPIVMPAPSDGSGMLDFVRIVRAEVIDAKPADVTVEIAPPPPVPEPRLAAPPPPLDAPAPAPTTIAVAAPAIAASSLVPILDVPAPPMPAPPVPITTPIRSTWRRWLRRAVLSLIGLATGYAVLVLVLIGVYRTVDPPRSTVMLGLVLTGQSIDYEPVPITSISSYLQRAVITSEDARFCRHGGVDWGALAEAMQDSRGGSTITMQVAKNLFLWPSRSYVRKAIEIPVALMIDFAWPKRRILEVYLNIAEWGPGVFGAEAAAQYHFGKAASRLSLHEATLLAASLPNPIAREAGDPGRVTALLASRLRGRVANSDAYVSCLGLRPMPRAEPELKQKPATATKPASKAEPWQTRTEPAKPPTPFNPWQN